MNGNATFSALKRRWWVVLVFFVVGAVAGALPEPERIEEQERTFTATHTLLLNDTSDQTSSAVISPNQVSLFVTTGEVPARAAESLDFSGNPASLASQVESVFDFTNGALTITANGIDTDRTERIADTFADELVSYLAERQDVIYQDRLSASLERLAKLEIELTEVTRDLARDSEDPILIAQQSAISRQYSVAFEQGETLAASPPVIGFTTLQRAQAVETTDRGLGAPRSRTTRGLLGAVVGVALGAGIAVLLGLLDRRIRSREQAEEVLDMRAKVLIPKVRTRDRDQLVVTPRRHDPLSDSYRTVRNVVSFLNDSVEDRERAPITLVVSPSPGDGKTSLAGNFAAAAAEAGRRTILVNADFRRPRLSTMFGPKAEGPLPFMLEDIQRLRATALLNKSGVDRLKILDLSNVDAPSGDLVRASAHKFDELTHICDHVIVDTSPIGATAEVLDLVPYADAIVMVVRVGNSTVAQAQRAIAVLRDLSTVPILLVVGGLKSETAQYDEYTDERASRPGRRRSWLPFGTRTHGLADGAETDDVEVEVEVKDITDEQERDFDLESVE